MIELREVGHRFGQHPVLTDVSVTLAEQRVAVIGGNGSGKSTFARLLNGLVIPDAGRVLIDGLDTAKQGREVRRKVGFVFTDPDAQIVMPTVAEDVAFGLRRSGLGKTEIEARVQAALLRFGLGGYGDRPAHQLSGGEKQLLALCSVLITEPATLVCDEPTTLLDLRNTRRIAAVLADLPQRIVLVTHQLDLVEDFDRVLVIDGGRIVADDLPGPAVAAYRALVE